MSELDFVRSFALSLGFGLIAVGCQNGAPPPDPETLDNHEHLAECSTDSAAETSLANTEALKGAAATTPSVAAAMSGTPRAMSNPLRMCSGGDDLPSGEC